MSDIEERAYNYYLVLEEYNELDSTLWVTYINWSNELTSKDVKVRKCIRRLKQAHANLSDYFKQKQ